MNRLEGKALVVAGAGRIGDEIIRRFASEGAMLAIGDYDEERAAAMADELRGNGNRATAVRLDGSDEASCEALVAAAVEEFGGIDGISINFADFSDSTLEEGVDIPMEVYDRSMAVNARGYFLCTRAAIPALIARGGGSIVYTSSDAAYMCEPIRITYAMGKAAVNALMRGVAVRHGPDRIRANSVAPGVITETGGQHPDFDAIKDWAFSHMALKERLGEPRDVAAMHAMLMSADAEFITGQAISVDGGYIMRP